MGRPLKTLNKKFDFSWDFKDYSIRTLHEDFENPKSAIRKDCPIELVKYNPGHATCYVLAYFYLDDEGYELHSVNGRLFEEIDSSEISEIWAQLQAAQKMLDAYFDACWENRDFDY